METLKPRLFSLLKLFISGGLIIFLFARIGLDNVMTHFLGLKWGWFGLSLAVFGFSNIIGALQWYLLLLSRDIKLSWWHILGTYHVGLFFNNFLIGYVGGDALRIYDIHKSSGDTTGAFSTVFFDRFIGFFSLTTLAIIVTLIWTRQLESYSALVTLSIILTGWLIGLYVLFNEKAALFFARLFKAWVPQRMQTRIKDIYYGIHIFRHDKRLLIRLFGISLVVQMMRIMVHYLVARAVGVDTSPGYFFIFIPIIALAASLPISLGGIGVREQSGVALFAQVGISSAPVIAFELLAYIVGILASIPGGIVFVLRKSRFDNGTSQS
jgi:hypothetical protein